MHRRSARLTVIGVLLLGAGLAPTALPAHAQPTTVDSQATYVAMGDSYSAGVGAGLPNPDCGRSAQGYPTLWANKHGITEFTDVTCGGAITDDVLANQISALSAQTDVVTITIGGNDVALGDQVSACLFQGDSGCATAMEKFETDLPGHLAKVDNTYAAIRSGAPSAKVYVLGYPHLFETSSLCLDLAPSQAQRKLLNQANDQLNDSLAQHAKAAGFEFVDVREAFAGHSACSLDPWIHPILNLAPLHPNSAGYRDGYFASLEAATA